MGLEQYRRILLDPDFRGEFYRGLLNNFVFALVVVPVQTGAALGLALLLNRPLRGMAVFRTFFFMPVVFPMALLAVIWTLIYSRDAIRHAQLVHRLHLVRDARSLRLVGRHQARPPGDHAHVDLAGSRLPDGDPPRRPAGHPVEPLRGGLDRQGRASGSSSGTSPCPGCATR